MAPSAAVALYQRGSARGVASDAQPGLVKRPVPGTLATGGADEYEGNNGDERKTA